MTARTEGVGPDADPEQGTWQPPTTESESGEHEDPAHSTSSS